MEDRNHTCTSSFPSTHSATTQPLTQPNICPSSARRHEYQTRESWSGCTLRSLYAACILLGSFPHPHCGACCIFYEAHLVYFPVPMFSQLLTASDFFLMAWFSGVAGRNRWRLPFITALLQISRVPTIYRSRLSCMLIWDTCRVPVCL